MKTIPTKIHGIPVVSIAEAAEQGFQSITTSISAETEKHILAGVSQHRNPDRCAFIHIGLNRYELALKREDISNLKDDYSKAY